MLGSISSASCTLPIGAITTIHLHGGVIGATGRVIIVIIERHLGNSQSHDAHLRCSSQGP